MSQVAACASPDDNPIDWPMIQSLYLQGLGPTAISQKTGVKVNTISVMATRKGWAESLRKANAERKAVTIEVQAKQDDSPALAKQSARVREGLASVLTRFVEKIESMPVLTHKAALRASGELESVVRNAKTVFGWSEGQSQPAVRISIMGSAVAIAHEPGPVIDVTPTPDSLPPTN